MDITLIAAVLPRHDYGFPPSHPWYYMFNPPLAVRAVMRSQKEENTVKLPKKFDKVKFGKVVVQVAKHLEEAIISYEHACKHPYEPMAWETTPQDIRMGRFTSISLTHNHVLYYTGQLNFLIRIAKENNLAIEMDWVGSA